MFCAIAWDLLNILVAAGYVASLLDIHAAARTGSGSDVARPGFVWSSADPTAVGQSTALGQSTGLVPPPKLRPVVCESVKGHRLAAVHITGGRRQLVLDSALRHVVQPLKADGFYTHVYMLLTSGAPVSGEQEDPAFQYLSGADLQQRLEARIQEAGGCLQSLLLPAEDESIQGIIPANRGQLQQYPPASTDQGRGLLKGWMQREALWNETLATEAKMGRQYQLVFQLLAESYWTGDILTPHLLQKEANFRGTLWTKQGCGYGGMNADAVILGRSAAPVLMTLFSSFMSGGLPESTDNAQQYMLKLVKGRGVIVRQVPFAQLPEGTARYAPAEGGAAPVCLVRQSWCGPMQPAELKPPSRFC